MKIDQAIKQEISRLENEIDKIDKTGHTESNGIHKLILLNIAQSLLKISRNLS